MNKYAKLIIICMTLLQGQDLHYLPIMLCEDGLWV